MKANARFSMTDAAAAEVVGTIMLVGITVVMMVGLSVLMLSLEGPRDRVHVDIRMAVLPGANGWGTGDEGVRIEHVGGEALPQATARVRLTVGATTFTAAGTELGQGFGDGVFRLGDTWQRTQIINAGDAVELLLIDDAGNAVTTTTRLTAQGTGNSTGGLSPSGTLTYVATGTAAVGDLSGFAAMQTASDGASATLAEAVSGGVGSTAKLDPASASSATVADPGNVRTSDDLFAILGSTGDSVSAADYTMPATGVVINKVVVGMEAKRESGGGQPTGTVSLAYAVAGGGSGSAGIHTVSSTSDAHFTQDVTSQQTWTVAAVQALTVTATQDSGRTVHVDHLYVYVEYATPLVTDANATFGFTGVPAGSHELQIRYQTSVETFGVYMWDGTTWNDRGTLDSASGFSAFKYTLQPEEYQAGALQVRITERDTGALPGQIDIDYMRIDTT